MNDKEILKQAIALISRLMGEMEAEAFEQEGFSNLSMRQLLYLETVAAAVDLHLQAAFYLAQVFIVLAAQFRQATGVVGFQGEVLQAWRWCVQGV